MPDYAHLKTDEELEKLEKRIASVYDDAAKEMTETVDKYFEQFKKRDEQMLKRVKNGEITEQYYKQWRLNQIGRGERYEALRDKLADRYNRANEVTAAYVNDMTPSIYSLNRNYAAYTIEKVADSVDFTLFDESTVRRLIVEEPQLMPSYPADRVVDRKLDTEYSRKQISSSITSGILQGKSIPEISKDLQSRMVDMERTSAIRTARTAMTSAQNAGRMDSYRAAQDMGIELEREWVATLDKRTRHAHQELDGQTAPIDEPFEVDGVEIMYPGDPSAPGYLVYNCRCTLVAALGGKKNTGDRWSRDLETDKRGTVKDTNYAEWYEHKTGKKWK